MWFLQFRKRWHRLVGTNHSYSVIWSSSKSPNEKLFWRVLRFSIRIRRIADFSRGLCHYFSLNRIHIFKSIDLCSYIETQIIETIFRLCMISKQKSYRQFPKRSLWVPTLFLFQARSLKPCVFSASENSYVAGTSAHGWYVSHRKFDDLKCPPY